MVKVKAHKREFGKKNLRIITYGIFFDGEEIGKINVEIIKKENGYVVLNKNKQIATSLSFSGALDEVERRIKSFII